MTKARTENQNKATNLVASNQASQQRQNWIRISLAILAVLALALYFSWPSSSIQVIDEARVNDDPAQGLPGAVITIEEFGDFGCSACWAWHHTEILERIQSEYGDRVRFVWRDFPVITPQSPKAAEAAQCAYDQGEFWAYHDYLFEEAGGLSVASLKQYAIDIGLDAKLFNQCLDSGIHQQTVDRDQQEANQRGFRGTPSFLINDTPLVGSPSYDTLKSVIEKALKDSES